MLANKIPPTYNTKIVIKASTVENASGKRNDEFIKVFVSHIGISSYSLACSQDTQRVLLDDTAITITSKTDTMPAVAAVRYTITSNAVEGITIPDNTSSSVQIAASTAAGTYSIIVAATPTVSSYVGTITAALTIEVVVRTAITGAFAYTDMYVSEKVAISTSTPKWINALAGYTVRYIVSPTLPDG